MTDEALSHRTNELGRSGGSELHRAMWTALFTIFCFALGLVYGREGNVLVATALAALCCIVFAAAIGSLRGVNLSLRASQPPFDHQPLFRSRPLTQLLQGFGVGLALIGVTHLGYFAFLRFVPSVAQQASVLYGQLHASGSMLWTFPLLVGVVVVEEVVWRGVVFSALLRNRGRTAALCGATVLYCMPQVFSGSWLLPLLALLFGLMWTAQRALGASLTSVVITHLVWDVGMFYVIPVAPPA